MSTLRKLLMPMDARSGRGVYSRGKPMYLGSASNSPRRKNYSNAAKRKLRMMHGPAKTR